MMPPIEPPEQRVRLDSEDLQNLARLVSGRMQIECPRCRNWLRPTIEARELRIGSSPDLSAVDASQPGRPRLQFYCNRCQRVIGFVQGDDWADPERGRGDAPTRWGHLEL
jgi:hypothetical protein|uniref:Uncharacterized protein n=1 Tax=uncultured Armatimonadetes bacterium TaxID=157466 RepID=A0A6J4IKL1_9BACT|nr:hypothetical protein AVDCRST_MAG63-2007 [uncultured Armatimonadetes bacterium]